MTMSNSLTGSVVPRGSVGGNVKAARRVYVKELVFDNRFEFPSVGEADKLYIAKDENSIYRWDEDEMVYTALGLQLEDIKHINGGNANGQQST